MPQPYQGHDSGNPLCPQEIQTERNNIGDQLRAKIEERMLVPVPLGAVAEVDGAGAIADSAAAVAAAAAAAAAVWRQWRRRWWFGGR